VEQLSVRGPINLARIEVIDSGNDSHVTGCVAEGRLRFNLGRILARVFGDGCFERVSGFALGGFDRGLNVAD
jgi:hypothetical protein